MSRSTTIATAFAVVATLSAATSMSASASTIGWHVGGTLLSGSAALATTAKVDEPSKLTVVGLTIECTGNTLNGVAPEIKAPNTGAATSLGFTGCKSATEHCEVSSSNINTVPLKLEMTQEGTAATVATLGPKTKTTFATIGLVGAECALAGTLPITGHVKALAPTGQEENELQQVNEIATEASGELKVGSGAASLKGSALFGLASSDNWSFGPGPFDESDGGKENLEINDEKDEKINFSVPGLPFINVVVGAAKIMYLTSPEGNKEAFKIVKNTCEGLLKAGQECSIELSFTPGENGRYLSDLLVPVREDGGIREEVQRVMLIANLP